MRLWGVTNLRRAAMAAALCAVVSVCAAAENFTAQLAGANEVPPINSAGTATFNMSISGSNTITFTLKFDGLSSNLLFAHIHFAQTNVAGGVMIFLCGGGGQPDCPSATSGTITGTITAANVVGPTGQGVAPGDLTSALEIIRDGEGYANMHTINFPSGEIRGQLRRGGRGADESDDN